MIAGIRLQGGHSGDAGTDAIFNEFFLLNLPCNWRVYDLSQDGCCFLITTPICSFTDTVYPPSWQGVDVSVGQRWRRWPTLTSTHCVDLLSSVPGHSPIRTHPPDVSRVIQNATNPGGSSPRWLWRLDLSAGLLSRHPVDYDVVVDDFLFDQSVGLLASPAMPLPLHLMRDVFCQRRLTVCWKAFTEAGNDLIQGQRPLLKLHFLAQGSAASHVIHWYMAQTKGPVLAMC